MEENIEIFENLDQVGLDESDYEEIENPSDDESEPIVDENEAESQNWREIFEADFLELFERKLS